MSKMYVLNKCTVGDFDAEHIEAVAVSESQERLKTEAALLNGRRQQSDYYKGEWKVRYEVSNSPVKVL
jgi:predicted transcriptional regulator